MPFEVYMVDLQVEISSLAAPLQPHQSHCLHDNEPFLAICSYHHKFTFLYFNYFKFYFSPVSTYFFPPNLPKVTLRDTMKLPAKPFDLI
jgi:hypothetical protein